MAIGARGPGSACFWEKSGDRLGKLGTQFSLKWNAGKLAGVGEDCPKVEHSRGDSWLKLFER